MAPLPQLAGADGYWTASRPRRRPSVAEVRQVDHDILLNGCAQRRLAAVLRDSELNRRQPLLATVEQLSAIGHGECDRHDAGVAWKQLHEVAAAIRGIWVRLRGILATDEGRAVR